MTLKIKFESGKEIELTREEFEELTSGSKPPVVITMPYPQPVYPQVPYTPWWLQGPVWQSSDQGSTSGMPSIMNLCTVSAN